SLASNESKSDGRRLEGPHAPRRLKDGLGTVWVASEPWLAFDAERFLCSPIGSLFRMEFWGAEKT
ncbi:MAG TPA: hypothetical protein VN843_10710, partial [Anaerolineales bacterium]|nr:hypothetical protein [Anaerolineales bacterium]